VKDSCVVELLFTVNYYICHAMTSLVDSLVDDMLLQTRPCSSQLKRL